MSESVDAAAGWRITPFDHPPRPAALRRVAKRALVRIYTRKRKQRPCGISSRLMTQLEAMGLARRRYGEVDTTGKGSRAAREEIGKRGKAVSK